MEKEINKYLLKIDKRICELLELDERYDLMLGYGGIVLYYFYLSRHTGQKRFHKTAMRYLEMILDNIEKIKGDSVCEGLTGIAWLIDICGKEGFIHFEDSDSLIQQFKPLLINGFYQKVNNFNFDFLYGSTGIACFFLQLSNSDVLQEELGSVFLELLSKNSQTFEEQVYYESWDFQEASPLIGVFDTGVAHGNTSIIYILNAMVNSGKWGKRAEELLSALLTSYNHFFKKPGENGFFFPNSFNISEADKFPISRMGWCYGDLTNAVVIKSVVKQRKFVGFKRWIDEVLINANNLKSFNDQPGLCHGSASCAHLFNRIYQITNNNSFKLASYDYVNEIIRNDQKLGDYSFLHGCSGVGLTLLGILNDNCRGWEKIILTN
ncbi:lanthionine synthetase LanC family protein [Pedobacter miscanthi]|uniref:lanthionine synthetase LanC family protein n=1 Tax=Pedobacter miscanthi TaxID=2259170 RepID=UPI00293102FD|nr:lanthionine synthetase LanC family protein [Pedobacter miscanthi]